MATIVSSRFNQSIVFERDTRGARLSTICMKQPSLVKPQDCQYNQHFALWPTYAEV